MSDVVVTGLIMGAAFAAYRLYDNLKKKRSLFEESLRAAEAAVPRTPKDLGRLTRTETGVYVPEKGGTP